MNENRAKQLAAENKHLRAFRSAVDRNTKAIEKKLSILESEMKFAAKLREWEAKRTERLEALCRAVVAESRAPLYLRRMAKVASRA